MPERPTDRPTDRQSIRLYRRTDLHEEVLDDTGAQEKKPCRGLHECDDCILERLLLMSQVSDQLLLHKLSSICS